MNIEKQPNEIFSKTLDLKKNRQNGIQLKDNSVNSMYAIQLKSYLGFRAQPGLNLLADYVAGQHPNYTIDTGVDVADAKNENVREAFLRNTSLKIVNVGTNVRKIIDASHLPNEEAWEEHVNAASNKLAKFKCKIESSNKVAGISPMSITVAYSKSQEGYVIGVCDAGRAEGKAKVGEIFEGAGEYHESGESLVGHYSSQHETGGGANLLASSRSGSFDIHSKLTAEAARFQCVRDHLDELTNSTVFAFRINKGSYFQVSFVNLWKNWDAWFNKEYNLDRTKIITGLRANKSKNTEEIKLLRGKKKSIINPSIIYII